MHQHSTQHKFRREVMWNILEPGDPYDIRKSMIARLPGDSKNFMGNHIQMVCLLQAAQIQRLCQYLDQYKLRYRQLQRRQLDRHSYEIQIKQLTQKLADQTPFRNENFKLRDFLTKQTNQLQQLKKQLFQVGNFEDSLSRKYHQALQQIEIITRERDSSKQQTRMLAKDIEQYIARISAIQTAKNRQIEQIRVRLTDSSRSTFEWEKRQLTIRFDTQISQLEYDNKKYRQNIELKNHEIQQLQLAIRQLEYNSHSSYNEHQQNERLQSLVAEYEQKYALLGQQIERLNLVLRQRSRQLTITQTRCQQWEVELSRKQSTEKNYQHRIRLLQNEISEHNTIISEYRVQIDSLSRNPSAEMRVNGLVQELERINEILRAKVDENALLSRRVNECQYQIKNSEIVKRENEELKRDRHELGQSRRKIGKYENRMSMLKLEWQRMSSSLVNKNEQVSAYEMRIRTLQQELENYRRRAIQLENNVSNEWKVKVKEYQQRLHAFSQNSGEYQNKISLMKQEMDRLNQVMRMKDDEEARADAYITNLKHELETYRKKMYQHENAMTTQLHQKLVSFQRRVTTVSHQNDDLRRKVIELTDINHKLNEQIDHFRGQFKNVQGQLEGSRRKYNDFQTSITYEWQTKVTLYEQKLSSYSHQNQQLRRRVNQQGQGSRKLAEYENKIALLSQQIERLTMNYRSKADDLKSSEDRIRTMQVEIDSYQRSHKQFQSSVGHEWQSKVASYEQRIHKYTQQGQELRRIIAEYEKKLNFSHQQIEKLNQNIRIKTEQYSSYDHRYRSLQQQLQTLRRRQKQTDKEYKGQWHVKITNYEKQISSCNYEIQEFKARLQQAEGRIRSMAQEIERLNQTLRVKVQELSNCENRLRTVTQQMQILKRRVNQTEASMTHQWNSKTSLYEQKMVSLSTEYQQLRRRYGQQSEDLHRRSAEYENRISRMGEQIERINQQLRVKVDQLSGCQNRNRSLVQQVEAGRRNINELEKVVTHEWQTKAISFEQRINSCNRQNEELKRLVAEAQNRIALMNQQLERLNFALQGKVNELNNFTRKHQQEIETYNRRINQTESSMSHQWHSKVTLFEHKIQSFAQQNDDLRKQLDQVIGLNRTIPEYQNRIALLTKEVQRLNLIIQRSSMDKTTLSDQLRSFNELKNRFNNLTREYEELKKQYRNLGQGSDRNNVSYNQQLERLNQQIRAKVQELNRYENTIRNLQRQLEILNRKFSQIQQSKTQEWHSTTSTYEQKLIGFGRDNDDLRKRLAQAQNRISFMSQEIERLNLALREKIEQISHSENRNRNLQSELQGLKKRIVETESSMNHEWTSKITTYETSLANYGRQNQQLRRAINQLNKLQNRRTAEYQNKVALMGQQIERLNQSVRIRVEESNQFREQTEGYRRRIVQLQESVTQEWSTKVNIFEGQINSAGQQNERLRIALRQIQNRFKSAQQELQAFRRRAVDQENATSHEWSSKATHYEQRITVISRQLQDSKRRLSQLDGLHRKLAQYENRIAFLAQQNEQLNEHLREGSHSLSSEVEQLRRRENQLTSEIDRLNQSLRVNHEEFSRLQTTYSELRIRYESQEGGSGNIDGEYRKLHQAYILVSSQYENSKVHLVEYQNSIKKLYGEFEGLQKVMRQIREQNNYLKTQMGDSQGWGQKNRVLSLQINRLTQLTEQQKEELEEVRLRLSDDISLQKRISEHMALMVVLFAEIESLRRRVIDKEKEVQEVRRSSLAPFKSL